MYLMCKHDDTKCVVSFCDTYLQDKNKILIRNLATTKLLDNLYFYDRRLFINLRDKK